MKIHRTLQAAVFAAIALSLPSQSFAGDRSGGGGVIQNGRTQTFYSAGIVTEVAPQAEKDIPNLTALMNDINQMAFITDDLKAKLISVLSPSSDRAYYKVLPDFFDKTTEKRLIAEFSRLTRQNPDSLVLFAVTDTPKRVTYLLPSFYKLTPTEQKAILGHEAFWIINPDASYEKVVQFEYALQAYLENPSDYNRAEALIGQVGTSADRIKAIALHDAQTHVLDPLMQDGKLPLPALLGADYIACRKAAEPKACADRAYTHLFALRQKYPASKLLVLLTESMAPQGNGISLTSAPGEEYGSYVYNYAGDLSGLSIKLQYSCYGSSCGIAAEGSFSWTGSRNEPWQWLGKIEKEVEVSLFVP